MAYKTPRHRGTGKVLERHGPYWHVQRADGHTMRLLPNQFRVDHQEIKPGLAVEIYQNQTPSLSMHTAHPEGCRVRVNQLGADA